MCLLQLQYESSSEEEDTGVEVPEGGSPHSLVGLVDVEDMGQVIGKMELAPGGKWEGERGTAWNVCVFNLTGYYYCMWNVIFMKCHRAL